MWPPEDVAHPRFREKVALYSKVSVALPAASYDRGEENLNPMSIPPLTNPFVSGEANRKDGLDFDVYQNLKIGIHRELLNHVDLEHVDLAKVATERDDHARRQVYAAIQECRI
jgi:hypothetical protein